ncbi:MAG: hypothetical protein ABIJ57_10845 [Pseudomonadota bacterium]
MAFGAGDDVIGRTMGFRYDADNTIWAYCYAENGATAKTPGKLEAFEAGWRYKAIDSNTHQYYVCVPPATMTSASYGWVQVGGPFDSMVTPSLSVSVGHALGIGGALVKDVGSDYSGGATEFAVCRTATSSIATCSIWLVPRMITAAAT